LIIITHNNQYYFVEQIRAGLLLPEECYHVSGDRQITPSCNEEANWVVAEKIKSNLNIDELIVAVNEYCQKLQDGEPNLKRQGIRALPYQDINSLEYSFYQKLMKLNLHSELLPF
jgi:hypothetical protein